MSGKPRVLIAPLDWGLGHATRCVPIIRELLAAGAEPWLAGEGVQQELLKSEFPYLPFLHLPGYRIRYARSTRGLAWKMIFQAPKLQRAIRAENKWLKKMISEHGFDAVISDNRYGLYHEVVPCVFITHQLRIKSSWGRWTENILQKKNYRYISRYRECWLPDDKIFRLAGELAHPAKMPPVPVHYIGWLSRFNQNDQQKKNDRLVIVISGPEPQRSILENKIVKEIAHYPGSAVIIRGLPGKTSLIPSTNMLHFYNHLPAEQMEKELNEASFIIMRSGYSSIMDALKLQKKCIVIPTPGQTEQEWLGKSLMDRKVVLSVSQDEFSLMNAVEKANQFNYELPAFEEGLLKKNTSRFLSTL